MIRSLFLSICALFGGCADAAPPAASGAPAPASANGASASAPAPASAPAAVRQVDVATLKADLDRGAVPLLVDVRTPGEFTSGHVPGAKNIPLDVLEARIGELGTAESEVYVICQSGARSSRASATLQAKGLRPVNVTGGTGGWKASGYPVEN
ncbi:MAG: rhodanese-like domain-containing protein [Pseudomonadota bacterium]|nr:rhodanese-like domain-containing protein [Pseudomonadota bacterium]